jgi:hypothetical protein
MSPQTKEFIDSIKLTNDSIVNSVIEKFVNRSKIGFDKYQVTMDREDLGLEDWLVHNIEETMDSLVYQTKILKLLREKNAK